MRGAGGGPKKGYRQSPEHISRRIKKGDQHPNWKGDLASIKSGRSRALRKFTAKSCEKCGRKDDLERHHVDGNTLNNNATNITILCPRCHMTIDGRLKRLKEMGRNNAIIARTNPKPCIICRTPYKPLRKGRCANCDDYFRRNGIERGFLLFIRKREQAARDFEAVNKETK